MFNLQSVPSVYAYGKRHTARNNHKSCTNTLEHNLHKYVYVCLVYRAQSQTHACTDFCNQHHAPLDRRCTMIADNNFNMPHTILLMRCASCLYHPGTQVYHQQEQQHVFVCLHLVQSEAYALLPFEARARERERLSVSLWSPPQASTISTTLGTRWHAC